MATCFRQLSQRCKCWENGTMKLRHNKKLLIIFNKWCPPCLASPDIGISVWWPCGCINRGYPIVCYKIQESNSSILNAPHNRNPAHESTCTSDYSFELDCVPIWEDCLYIYILTIFLETHENVLSCVDICRNIFIPSVSVDECASYYAAVSSQLWSTHSRALVTVLIQQIHPIQGRKRTCSSSYFYLHIWRKLRDMGSLPMPAFSEIRDRETSHISLGKELKF